MQNHDESLPPPLICYEMSPRSELVCGILTPHAGYYYYGTLAFFLGITKLPIALPVKAKRIMTVFVEVDEQDRTTNTTYVCPRKPSLLALKIV